MNELVNPEIEFAKELPHFFSKGTYTEVEGTKEDYDYGLVKRLLAKEEDCCDIEWYRWPQSDASLDECIRIDVEGYNIGAPNPMVAKINYFNEPGDSDYTFVAFPAHIRDIDYLVEICYFKAGSDYVSFEMLSRTKTLKLTGTNLEISIPKAAQARPIPEEDKIVHGFLYSFGMEADWLPAIDIYVWDKDGDMDHFKDFIAQNFVLQEANKETITLAGNKEVPGMKLRYYSDASENSNSNIEWLLDLGDKYVSVRCSFMHDFTYQEVVARGILASIK